MKLSELITVKPEQTLLSDLELILRGNKDDVIKKLNDKKVEHEVKGRTLAESFKKAVEEQNQDAIQKFRDQSIQSLTQKAIIDEYIKQIPTIFSPIATSVIDDPKEINSQLEDLAKRHKMIGQQMVSSANDFSLHRRDKNVNLMRNDIKKLVELQSELKRNENEQKSLKEQLERLQTVIEHESIYVIQLHLPIDYAAMRDTGDEAILMETVSNKLRDLNVTPKEFAPSVTGQSYTLNVRISRQLNARELKSFEEHIRLSLTEASGNGRISSILSSQITYITVLQTDQEIDYRFCPFKDKQNRPIKPVKACDIFTNPKDFEKCMEKTCLTFGRNYIPYLDKNGKISKGRSCCIEGTDATVIENLKSNSEFLSVEDYAKSIEILPITTEEKKKQVEEYSNSFNTLVLFLKEKFGAVYTVALEIIMESMKFIRRKFDDILSMFRSLITSFFDESAAEKAEKNTDIQQIMFSIEQATNFISGSLQGYIKEIRDDSYNIYYNENERKAKGNDLYQRFATKVNALMDDIAVPLHKFKDNGTEETIDIDNAKTNLKREALDHLLEPMKTIINGWTTKTINKETTLDEWLKNTVNKEIDQYNSTHLPSFLEKIKPTIIARADVSGKIKETLDTMLSARFITLNQDLTKKVTLWKDGLQSTENIEKSADDLITDLGAMIRGKFNDTQKNVRKTVNDVFYLMGISLSDSIKKEGEQPLTNAEQIYVPALQTDDTEKWIMNNLTNFKNSIKSSAESDNLTDFKDNVSQQWLDTLTDIDKHINIVKAAFDQDIDTNKKKLWEQQLYLAQATKESWYRWLTRLPGRISVGLKNTVQWATPKILAGAKSAGIWLLNQAKEKAWSLLKWFVDFALKNPATASILSMIILDIRNELCEAGMRAIGMTRDVDVSVFSATKDATSKTTEMYGKYIWEALPGTFNSMLAEGLPDVVTSGLEQAFTLGGGLAGSLVPIPGVGTLVGSAAGAALGKGVKGLLNFSGKVFTKSVVRGTEYVLLKHQLSNTFWSVLALFDPTTCFQVYENKQVTTSATFNAISDSVTSTASSGYGYLGSFFSRDDTPQEVKKGESAT